MDDTVVILSSDDETGHDKDDRKCSKKVFDSSNEEEHSTELSEKTDKEKKAKAPMKENLEDNCHGEQSKKSTKKRKIESTYLGKLEPQDVKKRRESSASEESLEDHKVAFDEFIDTCWKLDDGKSQMEKIVDGKLKKYYMLLVPEYRSSEQFITLLQRKRAEMERSPSQRFIHIKEVVDELNAHRSDKIKVPGTNVSDRHIRKLCKAMELIHRKIKKLEEKEVDWDEDGESSYIQLQRFRERLIQIDAKLHELEGTSNQALRRKISFSGTQFPSINRAIEKYVNVNGEFPDYYDIYHHLKMAYQKENIDISESKLKCEAKTVFQSIGEQLQNIRRAEIWEAHCSFLKDEVDPADDDEAMKTTLDENKKKFQASIDKIINTYAEKPTTKAQFESEDSNSSDGVKKKVKSENGHEENKEEVKEKEENNDAENDDANNEDQDDDDDDEDDDDDDEDNEKVKETVDDIIRNAEIEVQEEDTLGDDDCVFMNCGPVSPPALLEDESLSQSTCPDEKTPPVIGEEDTKEDFCGKQRKISSESSVLDESTEFHSLPGCSKWDNGKEKKEQSTSDNGKEKRSETVRVDAEQREKKGIFLKVKPLASLMSKGHSSTTEEILLD